jgi:hypothetical protein
MFARDESTCYSLLVRSSKPPEARCVDFTVRNEFLLQRADFD